MRYLVCLIVGLLVGAMGAMTAANILARRNPYPKALMTVMKHELDSATVAAAAQACQGDSRALDKLGLLAGDITTAMPDDGPPDRVFHQYVGDLQKSIDGAGKSDCPQRAHALTDLKNACDACHRDYR